LPKKAVWDVEIFICRNLSYNTIENPDVKGEITWTVARSGTGHGLSIWFDATLAEGIGFYNGPGMPELIYSMAFFPWSRPVPLTAGDQISVTLGANLVNEDYLALGVSGVCAGRSG